MAAPIDAREFGSGAAGRSWARPRSPGAERVRDLLFVAYGPVQFSPARVAASPAKSLGNALARFSLTTTATRRIQFSRPDEVQSSDVHVRARVLRGITRTGDPGQVEVITAASPGTPVDGSSRVSTYCRRNYPGLSTTC